MECKPHNARYDIHMTKAIVAANKKNNINPQRLLHKAGALKSAKSNVDAIVILEPYPARLASSEDPVPEYLNGWGRSADAKYRGFNAEVAQIFKGGKCLVAEKGGHLFEKRKKC